jgi:hypothetical protein
MRTSPIIAALLAMAAPAAAQPQQRCEVRFVRAPDDVRHVIETWLAAEPRCTSTIDLRVLPTDSGYYLIAQRPDGRIHERLVPDAQSAGVLVASWVADDWVAPRSDVWSTPRPKSAPAEPVLAPPRYTAPHETPTVNAIRAQRPRRSGGPRWISVGGMFSAQDTDDGGLRVELDVLSRGSFTLGAAFAWSETSMNVGSSYTYGQMRSSDYAATIYGAYTLRTDRWELRGAVGLGGVYSGIDGELMSASPTQPWATDSFYGAGGGVIGTASVLATRRLGDSWGVQAGVLGHVITESFPAGMSSGIEGSRIERGDAHVFLFTGLRRRI